ncbi:MAG: N-6 DNA methylase [Prevotella sp.]|nr:N-6 DNA methylase [Prevotella sp.]
MKIVEFNEKFKENDDLLIAVNALFLKRNVEETKRMVHIEMPFPTDSSISLFDIIDSEMKLDNSLVCVLPYSFLWHNNTKSIREELIKRDILDMVVLIPSNWLKNLNQDIALLFVNTYNRQHGIVKFIDATYDSGSDFSPNGWSILNLINYDAFPDSNKLCGEIDDDQIDLLQDYFDEFIHVVGHFEIRSLDYSLLPVKYIERLHSYEGYHLIEMVDIFQRKITNVKGRIIRVSDLKDSPSHYEIDMSLIEKSGGLGDFYLLNGKYVLVAQNGNLRPTLIDTKGEDVYIPCTEIKAYEENYNCLLEYAISELRKPYLTQQLDKWRNELVSWLHIYIPNDTDKKSSLQLQKDTFVQSKYHDVCKYCKHPDLLDMMEELGSEKIKTDAHIPNKVRNVMERYVLPLLQKNGIKPDNGEKPNTNIRGYSTSLDKTTPSHVRRSFHSISDLAPEGCHDNEYTEVQKIIRAGVAPYLTTSLVYDLFNVIVWCEKFED